MLKDSNRQGIVISVDSMGGDNAPIEIIKGVAIFLKKNLDARVILNGDKQVLEKLCGENKIFDRYEINHCPEAVAMDAKPSTAMRKKDTSMWATIEKLKTNTADAAISAGNTGALMAISNLQLRTMEGIHRPAIAALWPNPRGTHSVVLDVGANVDSDPDQLVEFAIMGEAYAKALFGIEKPTIGLLNVGSEDVKGHDDIREAMRLLREHGNTLGMDVYGFVEGTDISNGTTDVVVTDGFTGNIALKSAEGAAKLFANVLRQSLKSGPFAILGTLIASAGFNKFKSKMDPRSSNGGLMLGLNGLVVKSHGSTDAKGFAYALQVAYKMARSDYRNTIRDNVKRLIEIKQATK